MRYLLLAAILIGAAVVVADLIRERRAVGRIVPFQAIVAAALGRTPSAARAIAIPDIPAIDEGGVLSLIHI